MAIAMRGFTVVRWSDRLPFEGRAKSARTRRVAQYRPCAEPLEDRRLLAVTVSYQFPGEHSFGTVIEQSEFAAMFWGLDWQTNPQLATQAQALESSSRSLVTGPYMNLMREYYWLIPTPGGGVGPGTWIGTDYPQNDVPGTVLTHDQITSEIAAEVRSHRIAFDAEGVLLIYLPPGIQSQECTDHHWGAFHSDFSFINGFGFKDTQPYAVIPWPKDYPLGNPNAMAYQTLYTSHEVAEAVTNTGNGLDGTTIDGYGWYASGNQFADGHGREIGDLAAGSNIKVGYYNGNWVQALWSNNASLADHRILPAGTTNIIAQGNGRGEIPPGEASGVGFDEFEDPLTSLIPEAQGTPSYTTSDGANLIVDAARGVLSSFTDPEGSPLTAQFQGPPAHGVLVVIGSGGSFQYTPQPGFVGTDSFSVVAAGAHFQSMPTTITLQVAPAAPTLIAPASEAQVADATPTFRWSAVAGAATYDLSLFDGTLAAPVAGGTGLTGTSYAPVAPLLDGHQYRWTVLARDASGAMGPAPDPATFVVRLPVPPPVPTPPADQTPATPTPLTPTGNVLTATPVLEWVSVEAAVTYQVVVLDVTSHSTIVLDDSTGATFVATDHLQDGHAYTWSVRAVFSSGVKGAFSVSLPFQVHLPSPAPTPVPPPKAVSIASLIHVRRKLTEIVVAFDGALAPASATNAAFYTLAQGKHARSGLVFKGHLHFRDVTLLSGAKLVSIRLAKPTAGPLQLTVHPGIGAASGPAVRETYIVVVQ